VNTGAPPLALAWPAAELGAALARWRADFALQVLARQDSTNSELMRRARAGDATPTVLVAEAQTAGRGRMGRLWQSQGAAGDALTFSMKLPLARADWSGLSLAVGVAAAEALHAGIRVKWPNDLWWQGRKLAGILIETCNSDALPAGQRRQAVIGLGLNIRQPPGAGFSTPPAWLGELAPDLDAPAALARLLPALCAALRAFEQSGFAPWVARFAARDALAGQAVRLSDGLEGVARGVDATGALLLETASGLLRPIRSAEISVRPAAAAIALDE
jgi:BirA family biotin operon repressor/biotin-[acetyl-CoA-carboxylase] ligase